MVTGQYQQFIIEQLRVLYAITAVEEFKEIANRWELSMRNDFNVRPQCRSVARGRATNPPSAAAVETTAAVLRWFSEYAT